MVEPMSALQAAELAITSLYKIAQFAYDFKQGADEHEHHIQDLFTETESLRTIVQNIQLCLQVPAVQALSKLADNCCQKIFGDLTLNLGHCARAVQDFHKIFAQQPSNDGAGFLKRGWRAKLLQLKDPLNTEARHVLGTHVGTLQVSLSTLQILQLSHSEVQRQQGLHQQERQYVQLKSLLRDIKHQMSAHHERRSRLEATVASHASSASDTTTVLQDQDTLLSLSVEVQKQAFVKIRALQERFEGDNGEHRKNLPLLSLETSPESLQIPSLPRAFTMPSPMDDMLGESPSDPSIHFNRQYLPLTPQSAASADTLPFSPSADGLDPIARLVAKARKHRHNPRARLADQDFDTIAACLRQSDKTEWAERSRTYFVLRLINQLQYMDDFVTAGIKDISFPYTAERLPDFLRSQTARQDFLQCQALVLNSKATDLVTGGRHRHLDGSRGADSVFTVVRKIGKGGQGSVDVVRHKMAWQEYARKLIPRAKTFTRDKMALDSFENEVHHLKRLSHNHLVTFVGSYTDINYVAIIMDPVADCDLKAYMLQVIEKKFAHDCLRRLRSFYGCLASAVLYLHEQKCRHKDIKPGNVLLKNGTVLLTDFGIAFDSSELQDDTTMSPKPSYTVAYAAPEVLARGGQRSFPADIYALGLVFLEMTTILNHQPIRARDQFSSNMGVHIHSAGHTSESLTAWINRLEQNSVEPNAPLAWIRGMLQPLAALRPDAAAVLDHIRDASHGRYRYCASCCDADITEDNWRHSWCGSDSDGEVLMEDLESSAAGNSVASCTESSINNLPEYDGIIDDATAIPEIFELQQVTRIDTAINRSASLNDLENREQRENRNTQPGLFRHASQPTHTAHDLITFPDTASVPSSVLIDTALPRSSELGCEPYRDAHQQDHISLRTSPPRPSELRADHTTIASSLSVRRHGNLFPAFNPRPAIQVNLIPVEADWQTALVELPADESPSKDTPAKSERGTGTLTTAPACIASKTPSCRSDEGTPCKIDRLSELVQAGSSLLEPFLSEQLAISSEHFANLVRKTTSHARDQWGQTLLHHCAKFKIAMVVHAVVSSADFGVLDIDATDFAGNTALHCAAASDNGQLVRLLIESGAQVNKVNLRRQSPLHLTARYADVQTLNCVLRAADRTCLNRPDDRGVTPLHLAVRSNCFTKIYTLIDERADLSARDTQGRTPLLSIDPVFRTELQHALSTRPWVQLGDSSGSAPDTSKQADEANCEASAIAKLTAHVPEEQHRLVCTELCAGHLLQLARVSFGDVEALLTDLSKCKCEHCTYFRLGTSPPACCATEWTLFCCRELSRAWVKSQAPCKCYDCTVRLERIAREHLIIDGCLSQNTNEISQMDLAWDRQVQLMLDRDVSSLLIVGLFRILLAQGGPYNKYDRSFDTVMDIAVKTRRFGVVAELLTIKRRFPSQKPGSETTMFKELQRGVQANAVMISLLVEEGVSLARYADAGIRPDVLGYVVEDWASMSDIMPILLTHRRAAESLSTLSLHLDSHPLRLAIKHDQPEAVKMLVLAGVLVNKEYRSDEFALDLAIRYKSAACVKELIMHGGTMREAMSAFSPAITGNASQVVLTLLDLKILVEGGNDQDGSLGNSSISLPAVKETLSLETRYDGRTVLHELAQTATATISACLPRLLTQKLHLDVQDFNGKTALHYAARVGSAFMVSQLIGAGADAKIKDNLGLTAADLAQTRKHKEIVELLGQNYREKKWYKIR